MKKKIRVSDSLYRKKPKLAKEWHPRKNKKLTPKEVTPGSNKSVWWQCKQGHEWESTVANRTAGRNCPYCGNKKVCKDNCLATVYPELAKEWHQARNGKLTPKDLVSKARKKVWWKCKFNHIYKAEVYSRSKGSGCPYCAGKKACKENSFATKRRRFVKQWHPTKNGKLLPKQVTYMSDKKVWWKCDKGHEWMTEVKNISKGGGCPYCSGKRVCEDNCLATVEPKIAKEWHPDKNGSLTPHDVTKGSGKIVWWQCFYGHEWTARIETRTRGFRSCPTCREELKKLGYFKEESTSVVRIRTRG